MQCEVDSNGASQPHYNGPSIAGPGGGMYCAAGAVVDVDSCRFSWNRGYIQGEHNCGTSIAAIRCGGYNHISIRNSTFEHHQSCGHIVSGGDGTVMFVQDCVFSSNSGGIQLGLWGTLHLVRTRFLSNRGFYTGAALSLRGCNAWVTQCDFRGNAAFGVELPGLGGAISATGGAELHLDRCAISGNSAQRGAGGIYVGHSLLAMEHSTLTGNNGGSDGGGILIADSSQVWLARSVIWGNCAAAEGQEISVGSESFARLICSAVRADAISGNVILEGEQILTDPELCDPPRCEDAPTDGGVLTLAANSPCLPQNSPCGELVGVNGAGCAVAGACCTAQTECLRMSAESCASIGGVFLGDLACLPSPCGGACCLDDGSCSFLSVAACEDAAGTFRGFGTTCDVQPCPPIGACCLPNSACQQLTQVACLEAQGTYLADRLECPPYPCGPNRGGVLTLHTNPALTYTTGQSYCGQSPVESCGQTTVRADERGPRIVSVLAAFPGEPTLSGLSFGVFYNSQKVAIVDHGSCADHEFATNGWPAPSTGTSIRWDEPRTTPLVEVYWFAAYTYDEVPAPLRLEEHPTEGAVFLSPTQEKDIVTCLGRFGFHMDGMPCCPSSAVGACCVTYGSCAIRTEAECDESGGQFFGVGTDCLPLPCLASDAPRATQPRELVAYRGPNPVSSSDAGAAIRFELSLRSRQLVRVRVYGAAGQLLRTVFEQALDAGEHPLAFQPASLRFAAGVYYFEVQVGTERRTRKLVVTR